MCSVYNVIEVWKFFLPSESKDQNEIVYSNLNALFFLNGRTPEVLRYNLVQNMQRYIAGNMFLKELFCSYGRYITVINDNRNYMFAIGN